MFLLMTINDISCYWLDPPPYCIILSYLSLMSLVQARDHHEQPPRASAVLGAGSVHGTEHHLTHHYHPLQR